MDIPTFSSRISPNYGVILKRTKEQAKDFNLWLDRMKLEGYKLEPEEVTLRAPETQERNQPSENKDEDTQATNRSDKNDENSLEDEINAISNTMTEDPEDYDDRLSKWRKAKEGNLKLRTMLALSHEKMRKLQEIRKQETMARRRLRQRLKHEMTLPKDKDTESTKESSLMSKTGRSAEYRTRWGNLR